MGEQSAIEWTDATVNFWWGCTKVGPGCDHCYADAFDRRLGPSHFGAGVPRRWIKNASSTFARIQRDSMRQAIAGGRRKRVFLHSMSDVFDLEVPIEWFEAAWVEIERARYVDLQIVTKRVSAVAKRLQAIRRDSATYRWPRHAGLIVTVVNQQEFDRDVPRLLLLKTAFDIPWVGLSIEPMLGPIVGNLTGVDWVICGGESGGGARPMHPQWARDLRDLCAATGVPFMFKQWGEFASVSEVGGPGAHYEFPDGSTVRRAGKKTAGRLLDGRTHDGFPCSADVAVGGRSLADLEAAAEKASR